MLSKTFIKNKMFFHEKEILILLLIKMHFVYKNIKECRFYVSLSVQTREMKSRSSVTFLKTFQEKTNAKTLKNISISVSTEQT